MILIVGGAYQGKRAYAEERFGGAYIVPEYHRQIEMWMKEEKDVLLETKRLLKKHSDIVIVMDEVGCGITPMGAEQRKFRDEVGKTGCYLAKEASEVHRVIAGIGTRIK